MVCNIYFVLSIISIILIFSIFILVLYKNSQDTIENFDTISRLDASIVDNNIKLQNLVNKFKVLNTNIDVQLDSTPEQLSNELETNIAYNINTSTNLLNESYNSKLNYNNSKIIDLENNLTDLENIVHNLNLDKKKSTVFSNIKSLNNGMEMQLIRTPKTNYRDPISGSNTSAYLVSVNNGCLSVGANDYDVYKCNDENLKQYFKLQHILNEVDYSNNIDKSIPFDNVDKSLINYPFAMVKSVNTDNCLTNNHGSLTVQPCYSLVAQRWLPLDK